MLNYHIAEVAFSIEGIEINKYFDKLNEFRVEKLKDYNVWFKFNKNDNLKFKDKILYKSSSLLISEGDYGEDRVYLGWSGEYAINKECEKNKYIIDYKSSAENNFSDELEVLNHLALERVFIKYDSFILHSSFIKYNNKGVLFTAPSGTGKSTQASLWSTYKGAKIVNGDRTVLRKKDDKWYGFGLPFSGSSEFCSNDNAPIMAIVILEQGSINKIRRCKVSEAVKRVLGEITVNYWNASFVNKVIDLLIDLISNVEVYVISCRPDKEAVDLLYNTIEGEKFNG